MHNKLDEMKKEYFRTPIPKELDIIVEQTIASNTKKKRLPTWLVSSAVAAILFICSINLSTNLSTTLAKVPILTPIIEVLTFKQYNFTRDTHEARIIVPKLINESDALQIVNENYATEAKLIYQQFLEETKANTSGHLSVTSDYVINTNNEKILSIATHVEQIRASSYTEVTYITIAKEKEEIITLPSLFKDDSYISIISEYIIAQMKNEMALDTNKIYFLKTEEEEGYNNEFEGISSEQKFYINKDNKLVIAFDEYEVAPGYMGIVTFEIPTELINDILFNNDYII